MTIDLDELMGMAQAFCENPMVRPCIVMEKFSNPIGVVTAPNASASSVKALLAAALSFGATDAALVLHAWHHQDPEVDPAENPAAHPSATVVLIEAGKVEKWATTLYQREDDGTVTWLDRVTDPAPIIGQVGAVQAEVMADPPFVTPTVAVAWLFANQFMVAIDAREVFPDGSPFA